MNNLLCYTDTVATYVYIQQILKQHGIVDTIGASYWYLQNHIKYMDIEYIPDEILTHSWAKTHLIYNKNNDVRQRLLLEKEHVREIAEWTEITHIGSQTRILDRKIDACLKELTD